MKFTDGNWLMREGVRASYPAQAYDVESARDSFTVYAPTRTIRHRGDTLAGPLLTVQFSSPMPDVIRVKLTHFSGQQPRLPQFALLEHAAADVAILEDDQATTLTSGWLSVRVPREDGWRVEFIAGNRVITSSASRGMGIVDVEGDGPYIHEQLSLSVGECVYGLGERFTAFVKNG